MVLTIFCCCIYLLVMPKYWGKQIFKAKSGEKKREKKEKKKKDRKLVITMVSLAFQTPPRVAHAKPPWPKEKERKRD